MRCSYACKRVREGFCLLVARNAQWWPSSISPLMNALTTWHSSSWFVSQSNCRVRLKYRTVDSPSTCINFAITLLASSLNVHIATTFDRYRFPLNPTNFTTYLFLVPLTHNHKRNTSTHKLNRWKTLWVSSQIEVRPLTGMLGMQQRPFSLRESYRRCRTKVSFIVFSYNSSQSIWKPAVGKGGWVKGNFCWSFTGRSFAGLFAGCLR